MKLLMISSVIGGLVMFSAAMQMGLFGSAKKGMGDGEEAAQVVPVKAAVVKKVAPVRAKFPDDLAPAAKAQPVAAAAEYKAGNKPHKLVFLKVNGALHPWHADGDGYSEDWMAGNVEETELAVIVGGQKKSMIERAVFSNGPPIDRNKFELEVSVVEVKTGKVRGNKTFINMPRRIAPQELYEVTALGSPVHYRTVFAWLSKHAKEGFTTPDDGRPIIHTVERQ